MPLQPKMRNKTKLILFSYTGSWLKTWPAWAHFNFVLEKFPDLVGFFYLMFALFS